VGGGSAIYNANSDTSITDTIVASYTTGITVAGGSANDNYNLFFGNGTDTAGTSGGTHDVHGNPLFVNPAAGDYHLDSSSAAINAGTNSGITTDIDGDPRPFGAGFDIGYDEAIAYRLYLPVVQR